MLSICKKLNNYFTNTFIFKLIFIILYKNIDIQYYILGMIPNKMLVIYKYITNSCRYNNKYI